VRQGDDVMADPEEEAEVPGQQEAVAGEISDGLTGTDEIDTDEIDDVELDDDELDEDEDEVDQDVVDQDEDAEDAEDEVTEVTEVADESGDGARPSVADLELESEIAADYIEGLLDVADLDGDIDMDVEGERAFVSVVGATLDELVGRRGEVLEALQELTRLAVHRQTGNRTRIMLDVGGYRQKRRAELAETGRDAADEVKRTGQPKRLWAMNPFERKIVHDAVAAAGLRSESEGEEPERRVVVLPVG
jgi:spoIIIJ-associated protein